MPSCWLAARKYFQSSADGAAGDEQRRLIFDQAAGKLSSLILVPGDLGKEIAEIRREVGDKLSALENARADAAAATPAGLRKSRHVSPEMFAAAHGNRFDDNVAGVIELE